LKTHYPAGYPTGKPGGDHLWYTSAGLVATVLVYGKLPMSGILCGVPASGEYIPDGIYAPLLGNLYPTSA